MPDAASRRSVLKIGGGGALALVIGGVAGWLDRRDDTPADGAPPTTSSPSGPSTTTTSQPATSAAPVVLPNVGAVDPGIIALGQRVVATTGWSDLGALLAAVPAPEDDPIAQAATVVRDEFRAGDTVDVDGWVLARSEARAAAIVALICEDAC